MSSLWLVLVYRNSLIFPLIWHQYPAHKQGMWVISSTNKFSCVRENIFFVYSFWKISYIGLSSVIIMYISLQSTDFNWLNSHPTIYYIRSCSLRYNHLTDFEDFCVLKKINFSWKVVTLAMYRVGEKSLATVGYLLINTAG